MVRKRECQDCKKDLAGKYYTFVLGKEGGKHPTTVSNHFCFPCAEKIKAEHFFYQEGWMKEIEWEVGNETDEEIQEFEEKWKKHSFEKNQFTKKKTDEKLIISWLQEAKQDLEPYLQKLEIVEKSFGGKLSGLGKPELSIHYLFAKPAREGNYCQEVVEKIIAEILDGKFNQKINTTTEGGIPGDPSVPGYTGGILQIANQTVIYQWIDAQEENCCRIRLSIRDQKWALRSFLRTLAIKERELKGETKPIENDKSPNSNRPQEQDSSNSTIHPKSINWTLIIVLSIAGIAATAGLIFYLLRSNKI